MRGSAVLLLLSLLACGDVASEEPGSDASDVVTKAAPLEESDFARPIDKPFLRATNANLTGAAFEQKWAASHESPLMFLRAYPGGYHKDLAQVAAHRIVGKEDLCFGDAHLDNFGFLELDAKTKFVFNDLDDSGYCFVALDAARYFASLRLAYDDKDIDKHVLEQYVDTLKDASRAKKVDKSLFPDLTSDRARRVADGSRGDRLVLDEGLVKTSSAERAAIDALVGTAASFRGLTLLDVATLPRDGGGSGGLRRYHLLVDGPMGRTILELKESTTPASELGRHTKSLSTEQRLATLQSAFWSEPARDYSYVDLDGARFLVRDRLAKKSITLDELGKDKRLEVLSAQASLLALLHADALEKVKKDEIRTWLEGTSKVLAKRWKSAMNAP